MKPLSLILTVLLPTVLFGQTDKDDVPPPPPPPPDSAAHWQVPIKTKTYRSALYKIQFNYPSHWMEISASSGDVIKLGGLENKKDTFPDMLSLRVKYIGIGLSEEKRKQIMDTLSKIHYPHTELLNTIRTTLDSTEFIEQTVRGNIGSESIYGQYKYAICIKNGFLYTFSFLYNPAEEKKKEQMCQKIIASIKFIK